MLSHIFVEIDGCHFGTLGVLRRAAVAHALRACSTATTTAAAAVTADIYRHGVCCIENVLQY